MRLVYLCLYLHTYVIGAHYVFTYNGYAHVNIPKCRYEYMYSSDLSVHYTHTHSYTHTQNLKAGRQWYLLFIKYCLYFSYCFCFSPTPLLISKIVLNVKALNSGYEATEALGLWDIQICMWQLELNRGPRYSAVSTHYLLRGSEGKGPGPRSEWKAWVMDYENIQPEHFTAESKIGRAWTCIGEFSWKLYCNK